MESLHVRLAGARLMRSCALAGHCQVVEAEYWLYTFTCSLQPVTLLVCSLSCTPVE